MKRQDESQIGAPHPESKLPIENFIQQFDGGRKKRVRFRIAWPVIGRALRQGLSAVGWGLKKLPLILASFIAHRPMPKPPKKSHVVVTFDRRDYRPEQPHAAETPAPMAAEQAVEAVGSPPSGVCVQPAAPDQPPEGEDPPPAQPGPLPLSAAAATPTPPDPLEEALEELSQTTGIPVQVLPEDRPVPVEVTPSGVPVQVGRDRAPLTAVRKRAPFNPKRFAQAVAFGLAALITVTGAGFAAYYLSLNRVTLVVGEETSRIRTSGNTVAEVLSQQGIRVDTHDVVEPKLEQPVRSGSVVTINRAMPIYIETAEGLKQVYLYGGTVGDALTAAGIDYDFNDDILPAVDEQLYYDMRIQYVRVDLSTNIERESLGYETVVQQSDELYLGDSRVAQVGVAGEVQKQWVYIYRDGEEVSHRVDNREVIKEPVDEIILEGTKPTPAPTPEPTLAPQATPRPTKAPTSKPAAPTKKPSPTQRPSSPTVPSGPTGEGEVMSMTATAYTATGNKTATGTWPSSSRSRENPGTVAVNPSIIPYRTLLYIDGYGYAVAEDTGGYLNSHPYNIDLYMDSEYECIQWGMRKVSVTIIQKNYTR